MYGLELPEGTDVELVDRLHEGFLVRQFQRGNPEAFVALVRRYERRLLYFLRRFERDSERALDILQEVWMTAWSTRMSLQSDAAFRAWIYRIAHGKIVGAIRAEMRQRRTERERQYLTATAANCTGATFESAELVHFALSQVSPEHRSVLTLRFLEGMAIAEIAEVTNLPVGTVKSRLHYASQEILSVIEEQENARK
ncbi:MAG: rpoE 12 [Planctomycetaceae bacterium]|nr:rpoE 12 [Planctomycetaceae bacterium]